MRSDPSEEFSLLESVRQFPTDLTLIVIFTLLTSLTVLVPGIRNTPIRIIFGIPFLFFLPGYAFTAALFPEANRSSGKTQGITVVERITFAFGTSIALVPLVGLMLDFMPWGIRLVPIIVCLSGLTIGFSLIAAFRRERLPPDHRFSVCYHEWAVLDRSNTISAIMIILSVLLLISSVGYAITPIQQDRPFTEFYIVNEDTEGEQIAEEYPEEFTEGEPQPITIGIENKEHEPVQYTVIVQLERVAQEGGEIDILEQEELSQFHTTISHNETRHTPYEIMPTMTGEDLRLTFMLYKERVPEEPRIGNSYRSLHLWVTVQNSDVQDPVEISSKGSTVRNSNSDNEERIIDNSGSLNSQY